jgi:hypothetical protein
MNSEEAKDILQLCRPGHIEEDLNDPLFIEAFEMLEQDSELCIWFEEQQMVDAAICEEMELIAPAPHLKASILSGMRERAAKSDENRENFPEKSDLPDKTVATGSAAASSSSKTVWFRPWIGIAAAFLFASIILVLSRRETIPQVADKSLPVDASAPIQSANVADIPKMIQFLSQQMADFDSSKFDKRSEKIDELRNYLALYKMPNPSEIPQRLETTPTIGCVTFNYGGTQMSMICFRNGQVYHLITANKTDLDKNNLLDDFPSKTKIYEHQKQAFKIWSSGDQVYILGTKGTKKDLPEFI